MNKMTPRVLALYIRHRCQTSGGEGIIYSVNNDGIVQVEFGAMGPDFVLSHHVGYVKPILRRFSDMTFEDRDNEVFRLLTGIVVPIEEENLFVQMAPQISYLTSLGIDLFGLIDAGLAIDASISKDAIAQ